MPKVSRPALERRIESSLERYPVTLILGPRQCGKTTVARQIWSRHGGAFFDLEDPETPLRPDMAKQVLRGLTGLVVIDEVQREPELFPLLRVLADSATNARFLLLGSASLDLVRGVSESLAGRVAYVEMGGFDLTEAEDAKTLWLRGGFPDSFLAPDEASYGWRANFTRSFLERDIPQLGIRVPAQTLRRFWTMVAHFHGQVWNAAEFARSLGTKEDTARRYLDILSGTFLVRQLTPWYVNVGKRLVRSPKVYVRDSGILHYLLGLRGHDDLLGHPKLGLSWEGFAIEQVIRFADADRDAYFYATHGGAELDLLITRGGRSYGFEFKFKDAPSSTRSMRVVIRDLDLTRLYIIYPGDTRYAIDETIEVVPITACAELVAALGP